MTADLFQFVAGVVPPHMGVSKTSLVYLPVVHDRVVEGDYTRICTVYYATLQDCERQKAGDFKAA